jgi:hypothetical protein
MSATATASKPAKPATTVIGVKEIATKLGTDPRELRKFIRGLELGVGRGTRYAWPNMGDPTVKRIMREWAKASTPEKVAA